MTIKSKIIVHDSDEKALVVIKSFLDSHDLIGLKTHTWEVVKTLNENVDLGAVLLSDNMDNNAVDGYDIARRVHSIRRELPIFIRRSKGSSEIPDDIKEIISGSFCLDDMNELKELIDKYLFGIYYPDRLVHGILELTTEILASTFKGSKVIAEPPIVVRDQFIYGELFSLIALESDWCRGYMMVQTDEESVSEVIEQGSTGLRAGEADFRSVNMLLSEVTNMIWGSIKAKFMRSYTDDSEITKPQVPIIINHSRRFVSFGTVNPQLCFRYQIVGAEKQIDPISILQKFVFNLDWSPEKFESDQAVVEDCLETGELELL